MLLTWQVLRALGEHTQVPVPKVFCLCTDPSVIGTAFYIMEYLQGRIFIDPKLPVSHFICYCLGEFQELWQFLVNNLFHSTGCSACEKEGYI